MKREIQIAILAIVTCVLAIWGFKFISGNNLFSSDKTYYTIIENGKGINSATPVLISGNVWGSVISIKPVPENIKKTKLGFQVKKEIKLPNNTVVEIKQDGPMGGKELVLVFDKYCDGNNCINEGATLPSKQIGLLGSMITPEEMQPHVESITSSIDKTIGKLGAEGSDTPLDNTIRDLSTTMDNLAISTSRFANLMNKSSSDMEKTMANMAILTEALVSSNAKLSNILNNMDALTSDLSKVKMSETVGKTNKTIDQATISLKSVETTMSEATQTMKDLNKAVAKLSSEDGSLGMLMNDKELYDNLKSSTKNMDLLLQDVRLNPRRYLKVFGKKVPKYEVPKEDPGK